MKGDPEPCAAGWQEAGEVAELKRGSILLSPDWDPREILFSSAKDALPAPGPLKSIMITYESYLDLSEAA